MGGTKASSVAVKETVAREDEGLGVIDEVGIAQRVGVGQPNHAMHPWVSEVLRVR